MLRRFLSTAAPKPRAKAVVPVKERIEFLKKKIPAIPSRKNAPSSYALFIREKAKGQDKFNISEQSKGLSNEWKNLSTAEKQKYVELSLAEKEKIRAEWSEFSKKLGAKQVAALKLLDETLKLKKTPGSFLKDVKGFTTRTGYLGLFGVKRPMTPAVSMMAKCLKDADFARSVVPTGTDLGALDQKDKMKLFAQAWVNASQEIKQEYQKRYLEELSEFESKAKKLANEYDEEYKQLKQAVKDQFPAVKPLTKKKAPAKKKPLVKKTTKKTKGKRVLAKKSSTLKKKKSLEKKTVKATKKV